VDASQRLILRGDRSAMQLRIATMESASLCRAEELFDGFSGTRAETETMRAFRKEEMEAILAKINGGDTECRRHACLYRPTQSS
jgi:hypothetical protein